MKKILLTAFASFLVLNMAQPAYSFVRYEEKKPQKVTEMKMTGYIDYAPFGYVDNPNTLVYGAFHTVFQPMIDSFIDEANLKMHYELQYKSVDDLVQKVRQGEIDFFAGAYYQTEMFKGLQLLYPAALYNPITVFMLPNRINEVKSTDDLKKLKGVRYKNEVFSDFVERQVALFNPVEAETSYEVFEKLFTKEVDYVITGYYFGMLEAIKLGIRHQIAPAKQTLWNIPVFIGVSKTSRNRDMIAKRLTRYLSNEKNREILQQSLQQVVKDFEKKYAGVVPPTFGLENQPEAPAETAAAPETAREDAAGQNPADQPDAGISANKTNIDNNPDNKLDAR